MGEPCRLAPTEHVFTIGISYHGLEPGYVRMVCALTPGELAERKAKGCQEEGDVIGLQCFAYITNNGIGSHNAQGVVDAGRPRRRVIEGMFNSEQAYFGTRHMYCNGGSRCWNIYSLVQIARMAAVLELL